MPLSHWKNTDYAVFVGAQSLQKPAEFTDPDATANANLSARLPYMFTSCRFAHYLKCIVRDKIGSFKERSDMHKWLNNWVMKYVEPSPELASEEAKARRPLAAAEVTVEDVEGNPGYYRAKFHLRPHYQYARRAGQPRRRVPRLRAPGHHLLPRAQYPGALCHRLHLVCRTAGRTKRRYVLSQRVRGAASH